MIIAAGCKKSIEVEPDQSILGLAPLTLTDSIAIDNDPLSVQAYAEVVSDDYEIYGRMALDHLRHRGAVDGSNYFSEGIREPIMNAVDSIAIANANMTISQKLSGLQSDSIMTSEAAEVFEDYIDFINSHSNDDLTFGEAWYAMRNWEMDLIDNSSIGDDSKELTLIMSSILRNTAKYAHETGYIVNSRSNDCRFGRTLDCWNDYLSDIILDFVEGAIIGLAGVATGNKPAIIAGVIKATWKIAGIGGIVNIALLYADDDCACEDDEETGGCRVAKGFSLMPAGCDQSALQQTIYAWGHSAPDNTVFEWVIAGGTFPQNNNSTSITTPTAEVVIKQNSADTPVTLVFWSIDCNTTEFRFSDEIDLPTLVNSTGEMVVIGEIETNAGSNWDPLRYEFSGTWLVSTNSVLQNVSCTPHGQVVSTGIDFAWIDWLSTNPAPFPKPTVTGIVRNICSNNSITRTLEVKLH